MPALATVGDYVKETRRLLQDEITPYRYPDSDLLTGLSIGLMEAMRLRADLFLPKFDLPEAVDMTTKITMDPMYRSALVYYVVGRMQLRDDESTQDARAASLLTKFTAQLLTIQS